MFPGYYSSQGKIALQDGMAESWRKKYCCLKVHVDDWGRLECGLTHTILSDILANEARNNVLLLLLRLI